MTNTRIKTMARKSLMGLNLVATLLLLGALFILVNFIASRRYGRADLTRSKITALSDKTRQVVGQLKNPVTLVVFYQPSHRLYQLVRDLLEEYEQLSPKLRIEYVDPDQDIARAQQLAKQFAIERTNVVVFESGTRHKYLSDTDLAEYDYAAMQLGGSPSLKSFKGEEAFTSAILNVTQSTQPLIWITTGHGEKSPEDGEPMGLTQFKKYLERENMQVESKALLERAEIPQEVRAVIIPGPTRKLLEQELLALQAYLDKGGRVLALLDPLTDTGLEDLLNRWGVTAGNDIVVDPTRQLPFVSAANLFVTSYTQHPIVERMQTFMTLFPLARSIQPAKDLNGLTVTTLAITSPQGWGETQTNVEQFQFDSEHDLKGPVSIAVAVERQGQPPTRMVVIGDSDFLSNAQVSNVGNLDLALGALHWLAEQEQLIGIGPKPLESVKLNLTASQLSGIFWLSFVIFPCCSLLLGAGMWWLRRK
mgnify:FL=1